MRSIAYALLGLLSCAVIAWAIGIFVLHLPWELNLLGIEIAALVGGIAGAFLPHVRFAEKK